MVPIYIKQIEYGELAGDLRLIYRHGIFHSMTIDEDSSSIFVSSSVFNNNNEVFYIDSTEIELQKNAIVLRFDKETGRFVSYGYAGSSTMTTMRGRIPHYSSIICKKNRVFAPVAYQNDIQFQNQTINVEQSQAGKGIYIWDYNGAPLQYIDFNSATQQYAEPSTSLCLKDSILYISGYTSSDMTFGDISLNSNGHSLAYTAKYIDKGYDTLYSGNNAPHVSIEYPSQPYINIFPNPTNSVVSFTIPDNVIIKECYLVSANGTRQKITALANSLNLINHPTGIYYIEIITDNNIYKQKIIKL